MEIRCTIPCGQPISHRWDCSTFDICLVYRELERYSSAEKFEFIQNVRKPVDVEYRFPATTASVG